MYLAYILDAVDLSHLRAPEVDTNIFLPTIVKEEAATLTRKPTIITDCETANQKLRSRNASASRANQIVTQATVEREECLSRVRGTLERQNTAPANISTFISGVGPVDPLSAAGKYTLSVYRDVT